LTNHPDYSGVKIAVLIPNFNRGGVERSVMRIAGVMAELGCDVRLLVANSRNSPLLAEMPEGVRVDRLSSLDLPAIPKLVSKQMWMTAGIVPSLIRYIRREQPDAVLAAQMLSSAFLARILSREKFRLVARQSMDSSTWSAANDHRVSRLAPFVKRKIMKHLDGIVAVSTGVANDLHKSLDIPLSKLTVIHNPAADPVIHQLEKEPVNHPWLNDPNIRVGIGVARLEPEKDQATLINSLVKVREKYDARLIIIGEGELKESLTQQIIDLNLEDYVELAGFVGNPFPLMAKADVFLSSSAIEGFGNVLVEAMMVRTPVITTDCPSGPSEIVQNGELGELIPVRDPDAMSEAWLRVLDDPKSAAERAERAYKAMDQYTPTSRAKAYLALLSPNV
jgi:glycosyltransferase involved in cell wall biosynthesis